MACGALVASVMAGCALAASPAKTPEKLLTPQERSALIRRAQIWTTTDVGAADVARGPDGGFAPGADVECSYEIVKFGGHTPKFGCELAPHDVVKVRYGRDNGEVYAGVAATRLLWALGFGADALYPVHVLCRGCPANSEGQGVADARLRFDVAAIERPFPGHKVDTANTPEGWAWPELDLVDSAHGGAPRAQRDGLKLLAVLIQHSDNKSEQQRLYCRDEGHTRAELAACRSPFMSIHDLGQTFGRANRFNRSSVGSVNLDMWAHTPIWREGAKCVGNLGRSLTGSMHDPVISEEGRAFLAGLLERLTDAQLRELFTIARFDQKPHGGGTIDAWVAAFKQKRAEIVSKRCAS